MATPHSRRLADTLLNLAKIKVSELTDEIAIYRLVNEATAECLEVERVGIWLHSDGKESIECVDLYTRSTDTHSTGMVLTSSEYRPYFEALENERIIMADDAVNHQFTRCFAESYLKPNQISSMLDAPIFHDGDVVGVICCEHIGEPRHWTEYEQHFSSSLAACTAWLREQHRRFLVEEELKCHQLALERAGRLEAMGRMAAGCAHDFNNILTTIVGHLSLLELNLATNPETADRLIKLNSVIKSGQQITGQLLAFARREPTHPQPLDMTAFMEEITPQVFAVLGDDHQLVLSIHSGLPLVMGDSQQLLQVAINLASNARDILRPAGKLRISLQETTLSGKEHHRLSAGRYLLWSFADDGPGLPGDVLEHLFEPFVTTKEVGKGTGLGLATSYGIISRLGGDIIALNQPSGGAEFRIYLPVTDQHPAAA